MAGRETDSRAADGRGGEDCARITLEDDNPSAIPSSDCRREVHSSAALDRRGVVEIRPAVKAKLRSRRKRKRNVPAVELSLERADETGAVGVGVVFLCCDLATAERPAGRSLEEDLVYGTVCEERGTARARAVLRERPLRGIVVAERRGRGLDTSRVHCRLVEKPVGGVRDVYVRSTGPVELALPVCGSSQCNSRRKNSRSPYQRNRPNVLHDCP